MCLALHLDITPDGDETFYEFEHPDVGIFTVEVGPESFKGFLRTPDGRVRYFEGRCFADPADIPK